ncbi:hypothetical protein pb186bvf_000898 [Paramecium bursaria]
MNQKQKASQKLSQKFYHNRVQLIKLIYYQIPIKILFGIVNNQMSLTYIYSI